jgi:hypothetical protein
MAFRVLRPAESTPIKIIAPTGFNCALTGQAAKIKLQFWYAVCVTSWRGIFYKLRVECLQNSLRAACAVRIVKLENCVIVEATSTKGNTRKRHR